jgi:hypothetical protein
MHYQWDFPFLLRYAPLFWKGVLVTLAYTAGTIFLGLLLGLLISGFADRPGTPCPNKPGGTLAGPASFVAVVAEILAVPAAMVPDRVC